MPLITRDHKMHTGDRKVRRNTRHSLRNGFTAYRALFPEPNPLASVADELTIPRSPSLRQPVMNVLLLSLLAVGVMSMG